jgi:cell division protein FtsQ
MAGGGGTERGSRRVRGADSAVVPLPRRGSGDRLDLAQVLPSGRSLALAFGLLAAVFVAYWGARSTSVFAVDRIEVRGAPPSVARDVRAMTRSALGSSLLAVETDELEARIRSLPSVIAASIDRAFPHTLVVRVAAEHPVAMARRGDRAWLVAGSNRILGAIEPTDEPGLPRLWLPRQASVQVGRTLPPVYEPATRALASLREVHFPAHVKGAHVVRGELKLVLRNGLEVLFGDSSDVLVKLAVAAAVLPHVDGDAVYLDVSVPERPVSGTFNLQLEG